MGLLTDLLGDGNATYPSGFGMAGNVNPMLVAAADASMNANQAYYSRVTWGAPLLASAIAVDIGISSGNLCVSVYENTGDGDAALPGTLKASSGSVASPGTGRREIALSAPVQVNLGDWLAIAVDNTTIRIRGAAPAYSALTNGLHAIQSAAFPAPGTAAAAWAAANRLLPLVAVP